MQGIDKALVSLGRIPMILRTVRAMAASDSMTEILVVTRNDLIEPIKDLCRNEKKFVCAVPGGSTRAESVINGLRAVETEFAAIHDGARPFVTPEIIDAAVEAAVQLGAAAPAVPVKDTIKVAETQKILSTPDRRTLFAVQTPQVFKRVQILAALEQALKDGVPLTDDCSAAENAGMPVYLTKGSNENIKITTPVDLAFCEAILKWREQS